MAARSRSPPQKEPLASLRTPCYIVDVSVLEANAKRMLERAEKLGVKLRPHCKTNKTLQASLLTSAGTKKCITVSTLAEACFFAEGGFDDILYAVPITSDKLDEAASLSQKLHDFHIMVDNKMQADAILARPAPGESKKWSIVIMVDCGYGRDGVDPDDPEALDLAKAIAAAPTAELKGLYTHEGHSYDAKSVEEVVRIGENGRDAVVSFAKKLRAAGLQFDMVGVGSTPTCSNPPVNLEGVTEMHPGNYCYYDHMQVQLGSCKVEDVAVRVCTRVIGHYPKRNMLLIDCGWTGASAQGKEDGYGSIDGHPELKIILFKQEAGEGACKVGSADSTPLDFSKYPIGTVLRIVPWHSCASTHQHTGVHVIKDGKLTGERWQHVRGW